MSIFIGNQLYSKIYLGNNQVKNIYRGNQLYYSLSSYTAEAQALFTRMAEQPTDELKNLIDKTIVDLKAAGIWQALDYLYFMNVHTQQASTLNWIKDEHNILVVNSKPWTIYNGFASGGYLRTQFNPAVNGQNFTQNNSVFGIRSNARNPIGVNYEWHGAYNQTNINLRMNLNYKMNAARYYRSYRSLNSVITYVVLPNDFGLIQVCRDNSLNFQDCVDGGTFRKVSLGATGVIDLELFLGCTNLGGAPNFYNGDTLTNSYAGGFLNQEQSTIMAGILNYFETTVKAL